MSRQALAIGTLSVALGPLAFWCTAIVVSKSGSYLTVPRDAQQLPLARASPGLLVARVLGLVIRTRMGCILLLKHGIVAFLLLVARAAVQAATLDVLVERWCSAWRCAAFGAMAVTGAAIFVRRARSRRGFDIELACAIVSAAAAWRHHAHALVSSQASHLPVLVRFVRSASKRRTPSFVNVCKVMREAYQGLVGAPYRYLPLKSYYTCTVHVELYIYMIWHLPTGTAYYGT